LVIFYYIFVGVEKVETQPPPTAMWFVDLNSMMNITHRGGGKRGERRGYRNFKEMFLSQ